MAATSLVHRTSSGHTASPSTAAAATMNATSPTPPHPVVFVVLVCFSCVALYLLVLYAARVLLRCLEGRLLRAAWEESQAQALEPKHPSDANGSAGGVCAEAECAICLAELEPEGGERVRVLPACGHGFHAACVEAWLATRASCPTCRAPSSSRPSRTARVSR